MTARPEVLRHEDADVLAHAVAARLVTRLVDLQSEGTVPSVVLTGGGIADAVHRAVADTPARHAVDWAAVEVWWGDERYVPSDSDDRNDRQAVEAMLDRLPVDPARVHRMPAADGPHGDDVEAAAEAYAAELAAAAPPGARTPTFDVLMLGIGPDGHCASLFPGHPQVHEARPVVAVRDSPKPPPTRLSLTLGPLGSAREVWWLATGEAKATAVRDALAGADVARVPAAGPRGRQRTLWFLDRAAATRLP